MWRLRGPIGRRNSGNPQFHTVAGVGPFGNSPASVNRNLVRNRCPKVDRLDTSIVVTLGRKLGQRHF